MRFHPAEAHCTKDTAALARRYAKIVLRGDWLTPLVCGALPHLSNEPPSLLFRRSKMSPTSISPDVVGLFETPGGTDRRSDRRYPIVLRLQYKLIRDGRVERLGSGTTVNISSRGVLFDANDRLPTRSAIELALHWPVLLQGSCGLKLVMRGRVVRANNKAIAMFEEFREFRTTGRPALEEPTKVAL